MEYLQDGVRVINHHCPIDALSFGIPSWDSPPPTLSSPPAADVPGDATGGSPLRGRSPTPPPSSPPAADILDDTSGGTPLILKLGAMMALIKAGFMSLCHSLEERMAL